MRRRYGCGKWLEARPALPQTINIAHHPHSSLLQPALPPHMRPSCMLRSVSSSSLDSDSAAQHGAQLQSGPGSSERVSSSGQGDSGGWNSPSGESPHYEYGDPIDYERLASSASASSSAGHAAVQGTTRTAHRGREGSAQHTSEQQAALYSRYPDAAYAGAALTDQASQTDDYDSSCTRAGAAARAAANTAACAASYPARYHYHQRQVQAQQQHQQQLQQAQYMRMDASAALSASTLRAPASADARCEAWRSCSDLSNAGLDHAALDHAADAPSVAPSSAGGASYNTNAAGRCSAAGSSLDDATQPYLGSLHGTDAVMLSRQAFDAQQHAYLHSSYHPLPASSTRALPASDGSHTLFSESGSVSESEIDSGLQSMEGLSERPTSGSHDDEERRNDAAEVNLWMQSEDDPMPGLRRTQSDSALLLRCITHQLTSGSCICP